MPEEDKSGCLGIALIIIVVFLCSINFSCKVFNEQASLKDTLIFEIRDFEITVEKGSYGMGDTYTGRGTVVLKSEKYKNEVIELQYAFHVLGYNILKPGKIEVSD